MITIGSIENKNSKKNIKFKGKTFDIEYGEFSEYLKEVNKNLEKAKEYANKDIEKKMIDNYMLSFKTGSL